MKYNYIAIEGNIGAGKTSLAKMLAKEYDARLILEEFEDNSFLPKFYKDEDKYAFPLELSFLASRFQQLRKKLIQKDLFHENTISDYFINKSLIFARKTLADDLFGLYANLFEIISLSLPKPELLVYLYVGIDRLKENIQNRGRSYEQDIERDYLQKIQDGYFEYIRQQEGVRILVIDTNNIDFVNNRKDYDFILGLLGKDYEPGIHHITP